MSEAAYQFHDWAHCECCGFSREVLVVRIGTLTECECCECGYAWDPDEEAENDLDRPKVD